MYKSAYDGDDSRKGGLGRFHWKISCDSRHTEAVSGDEHESRRPRGGRVGRDTTRRSLRRILRAFVCVPGHVCLRENACFSRVTWPLRLAHKGQKRPEAIVRASRPHRDWLATAYAKESSSVEGSLWHGTPWGTGALVPWTKHLPASPPRNTPYRTSPSSSSASLLSVASRVYTLLFFFLFFFLFSFFSFLSSPLPPPSLLIRFFSFTGTQHHVAFLDVPGSRFSTAGPLENGKQSEYPRVTRAAVHDAICVRCNASTR